MTWHSYFSFVGSTTKQKWLVNCTWGDSHHGHLSQWQPWGKLQKIGSSGTLRFKLQFRTIWSTLVWGTFPTFPRIDGFWCEDAECECACECLHYMVCVCTEGKASCASESPRQKAVGRERRRLHTWTLRNGSCAAPFLNIWFDDLTPHWARVLTWRHGYFHGYFPLFPSLQKCIAIACPELTISSLGFLALPFILTHFNSHLFPLLPHESPVASPWLPHCLRTRWSTSIPSNSFPSEAVAACASVPRLTHQLELVAACAMELVEAGG